MSFAAVGVIIAGTSVGLSASGALNPTPPDLIKSSRELNDVEAQMFPIRRALEQAAQQGTSTTVQMPEHDESVKQVNINHKIGGKEQWVTYNEADWKPGGKYNPDGHRETPPIKENTVHVPAGPKTIDFSGYGSADVQAKVADEMAKVQLALSKKYDSQFIDQALEQEKLADPEGFAARQKMHDLIQEQVNAKPDRPVAELLNKQVGDELAAARGGRLDDMDAQMLNQAVARAGADRGGAGAVDYSMPLTTGFEGEQRRQSASQKALSLLTSGTTPEDVAYRREQQNLANLSAEVQGKTPESQFGSLSGAQNGPTPFVPGHAGATMPTGGEAAAQSNALNVASIQQNQANPWIAGISGVLGLGKAAAGLGWKPFATSGT
jgi:hypothetical protein